MTNEMIQKAKECVSAEELLALAKENGIEMTAEDAEEAFAQLHTEGELSDDELDAASGGGCGSNYEDLTPGTIVKWKGKEARHLDTCSCPKLFELRTIRKIYYRYGVTDTYKVVCSVECTECGLVSSDIRASKLSKA